MYTIVILNNDRKYKDIFMLILALEGPSVISKSQSLQILPILETVFH